MSLNSQNYKLGFGIRDLEKSFPGSRSRKVTGSIGSRITNLQHCFYSEKCRGYFTPVLFAKLQQGDRLGRVSIMALFNYVMRKVWLHQTRIGLSLYDITGQGFLRESDLGKNYVFAIYRIFVYLLYETLHTTAYKLVCEILKLF